MTDSRRQKDQDRDAAEFGEVPLRIPLQVVRRHWEATTGLTSEEAEALLERLRDLSSRTDRRPTHDLDRLTNLM
jgi:hypothetical protein